MKDYCKVILRKREELKVAQEMLKKEELNCSKKEQEYASTMEALEILQGIAKTIQQTAHSRIAEMVSHCLKSVFGEEYGFKIIFEKKRNKTEAKLLFVKSDMEIDPLTESGGGVVDVASFALRFATLLLTKPKKTKLLVLDEPFKHLSSEYTNRVKLLLERLAKEKDVQIIAVTHNRNLKMGKVVTL